MGQENKKPQNTETMLNPQHYNLYLWRLISATIIAFVCFFFNGQLFPNSLLDIWSVRLTKSTQLEKVKYCSKLFPTYIASHAYKENQYCFFYANESIKQTNKPRENKGDTKHKLHHSFFVLQKVKKAYAKEDVPIV